MKLTVTLDLPDGVSLLEAAKRHAWYVNGAKDETVKTTYQQTATMVNDLEREAKFHAEQYLRNISTMYETRPR